MKYLYALSAIAGLAQAHNVVTHFHINGVADSSCVRKAENTSPILDLASQDMACNAVASAPSKKCAVKAGDAIGFEWRTDPNIAPANYPLKDGTIPVGVTDDSHKGPCAIYMKKVNDASTAEAPGDGWFKISADGLDSAGTFCTDRLRLANAPQPGVVPKGIEPGDYLFRAEMLTLNNAGPVSSGGQEQPQFYIGCVQVTVSGTTNVDKPETVSIPGYLTKSSPGLIYDIWNTPSGKFTNYQVPGPAALVDSEGGSPVSSTATSSKTTTKSSAAATSAAATTAKDDDESTAPATSTKDANASTYTAPATSTKNANASTYTAPATSTKNADASTAPANSTKDAGASTYSGAPTTAPTAEPTDVDSDPVVTTTAAITEITSIPSTRPTTFVTVTASRDVTVTATPGDDDEDEGYPVPVETEHPCQYGGCHGGGRGGRGGRGGGGRRHGTSGRGGKGGHGRV